MVGDLRDGIEAQDRRFCKGRGVSAEGGCECIEPSLKHAEALFVQALAAPHFPGTSKEGARKARHAFQARAELAHPSLQPIGPRPYQRLKA